MFAGWKTSASIPQLPGQDFGPDAPDMALIQIGADLPTHPASRNRATREKLEEEILNIRRTLWPESLPKPRGRRPAAAAEQSGHDEAAPKERGAYPSGAKTPQPVDESKVGRTKGVDG
jgi:hypothetical protein